MLLGDARNGRAFWRIGLTFFSMQTTFRAQITSAFYFPREDEVAAHLPLDRMLCSEASCSASSRDAKRLQNEYTLVL